MSPRSSRRSLALTGLLTLAMATGAAGAGASSPMTASPGSDAVAAAPGQDRASAIVVLARSPLSTSNGVDRDAQGQLSLKGANTRAERARLAAERNAFKTWLRTNAPKATVTSSYDISLNAVAVRLNGTPLETLRTAPGVTAASYQQVYTPLAHTDPDLERIDGEAGWVAAGRENPSETDPRTWAGFGVKVGIIDSGIDADHPCFDDSGYPETGKLGDTRYTNNKVIVARVFNEQAKRLGDTPDDLNGHGTHVAGTVACNLHTPAVVSGAEIGYDPSGVAPGAQLGNYVVFPGPSSSGRSEDILNAMEAAAADGMDVLNMSLGGGYSGNQDLLTMAVDNLDRSGIVVAVAAGNDGPGASTTGSPGSAERALTAGASSVGHYVGVPITAGGHVVSVAAIGDFPVPEADLTAPLNAVMDGTSLGIGCSVITEDLRDQIALISRGGCTFGTKVKNAQDAGALAAIIVNNVPGDPTAMGADATQPSTIPAVMAPLSDREELLAFDGDPVTMGADLSYARTDNDDILASFSSWGPTRVNYRVKPDVVAPGVNVLSAQPLEFCADDEWVDDDGCWAFYQGTSMATPHLAGMAAVVMDAHESWAAWQVRSAVANTAKIDGVYRTEAIKTVETGVQKVGNGLADLDAAVEAEVAFDRTTMTFGAVPAGSGRALSLPVTVTNLTDTTRTFPVLVGGDTSFTVSAKSVTVPAGGSVKLAVTFTPAKGEVAGSQQAHLYVGSSHMALYVYVK